MNNKKKKYVGSFVDERDAAELYDKVAILTHGMKVLPFFNLFEFRQKQTLAIQSLRFFKSLKRT